MTFFDFHAAVVALMPAEVRLPEPAWYASVGVEVVTSRSDAGDNGTRVHWRASISTGAGKYHSGYGPTGEQALAMLRNDVGLALHDVGLIPEATGARGAAEAEAAQVAPVEVARLAD